MTVSSPHAPRPSLLHAAWNHRWFLLFATALIVIAGAGIIRWRLGPEIVVDAVKRGNLVRTVVASGHFETPFRVEIGSQITGVVKDVLVDQGQTVKAGQDLIHLDDRETHAAVVQAEGALAQAEARVRQLADLTLPAARETLSQAKATLIDAQSSFDRTASLQKTGSTSNAALDDAQKNLDVAKAQVRSAELQVFTASPGGSDFVLAETEVNQARAMLEAAQSRLAYTTITAPRDGVLISRNVERGTIVQPGKPLLVLAPDGISQLVIDVDERNLGLLALGQSAIASADAYPDEPFTAHISYINPAIDISKASVEVKLDVEDPPSFLRQDMTISVDVEVARRNHTLVVPTRSVHDLQSGHPWVLQVIDGRALQRPVTIGLRGLTEVEISDGLNEGDLIVPSLSGVVSGQRIRTVVP